MTETKVNPEDNQGATGQVEGEHGQTNVASSQGDSQPEVELPTGEKVALEELKKGYMKDADYRRKTSEIAAERERLEAEVEQLRRERLSRPTSEPIEEPEEVNPIVILNDRLTRVEMLYAKDYLTSEINRLANEFPDADRATVFNACWSNPNAVIKDEMKKSHEGIVTRVSQKTSDIDALLETNPEAREKLRKKFIDEYNAKKQLKSDASTGTGAGTGSQTVVEPNQPAKTYKAAGAKLKEQLKALGNSDY